MKLVETDTEGPEEPSPVTKPRPEHRRVAVSALLTFVVLAGTVVTVYLVFPKRDNQLMTRAFEFHHKPGEYDLERPVRSQLVLFSLGILGKVPWPEGELRIIGVKSTSVLSYPAVMVRYEIAGVPVSLVVQKARDAPPRRYHREHGKLRGESWRESKWTFVAIGPAEQSERWLSAMGVP